MVGQSTTESTLQTSSLSGGTGEDARCKCTATAFEYRVKRSPKSVSFLVRRPEIGRVHGHAAAELTAQEQTLGFDPVRKKLEQSTPNIR